jgi:predicted metal-dependent hydrolase
MAFKEFSLDERTTITVYKRKASRSLKLSIGPTGKIRVSIPTWAPYTAGLAFARSRQAWIEAQLPQEGSLQEGQSIGKAHHLHFKTDNLIKAPVGRLRTTEAVVSYPALLSIEHPSVQKAAQAVSVRALRAQAEALLPGRLATLATKHDFTYHSVSIKVLKSRWGSCDSDKNIVLNLYLMKLPWENIDYVLLHELTHTRILQHGPKFWSAMEDVLPNVKQVRKSMRAYKPTVLG